jgi:hypothetical protein
MFEQYPVVIQDALVNEDRWRKLVSMLVSLGPRSAAVAATDENSRREKLLEELFGNSAKKRTVSIFRKKKNTAGAKSIEKLKGSRDDSSPVAGGSMEIDEREAAIASLKRQKHAASKEVNIFQLFIIFHR